MRRSLFVIASGAVIGLALALVPQPGASAAAPVTASCTDGGGHLWQGSAVWDDTYTDGDGVERVRVYSTGFTTAAPDTTSVDFSVTTYDEFGARLQRLRGRNRAFDFGDGTRFFMTNPANPPSAPGQAKVVIRVGDADDGYGSCTITFVQPDPGSAPAPEPTPTPTADPTPTAEPTPTTTSEPAPTPPTESATPTESAAPTPTESPTGAPTPAETTLPPPAPTAPSTTASAPTAGSGWPSAPPAKICGDTALLSGPSSAPAGAVTVPAGNNSSLNLEQSGQTYWFAPGVHTLGSGEYDQIAPGDNSTYLGGPGAILDGQGKNNYAFTQHGRDVTIKYLTVRNFVAPTDEGTVNHDSGEGWTMQYLTVTDNGGAGIFLGAGNRASYNCLKDNSQYGFQAYGSQGGEFDIVLDHNEIAGNNTGDWERKKDGCGCTGGGKFWDVRDVQVTNNYVHDNLSVGLWADTDNNNFLFEGNWVENNDGQGIFWETSYNAAIRHNVLKHNLRVDGPARIKSGDNFPDAAIYISESGGDARLPHGLVGTPTIDISDNLLEDNYNGVTLWENADRFCGSPANSSSDYCTLVNPSVANLSTCNATNIGQQPYYSDCRWKTQNVKVTHNTFMMNRANFFDCPASMCGRNSIVSNYGTYPSWSPFEADKVSRAIVFDQGNVFSDNSYVGSWSFVPLETGELINSAAWQAAPYNQDARSTFHP